MGRFSIGAGDPATRVLTHVTTRHGVCYAVPTVRILDLHLVGLRGRARRARQDGNHALAAALAADMDLLLERRPWLTMRLVDEPTHPAGGGGSP